MACVNWVEVIEGNRAAILDAKQRAARDSKEHPDGREIRLELLPDGAIMGYSEPDGCTSFDVRRGRALVIGRYPGGAAWSARRGEASTVEEDMNAILAFEAARYGLYCCETRKDAVAYVEGLKLTLAGLDEYAASLGLSTLRGRNKAEKIQCLVEFTVWHDLDRQAIWGDV